MQADIASSLVRARALLDGGDLAAAERLYVDVLAVEPALVPALRARAEIALARNDPAAALTFVKESLGAALSTAASRATQPVRVLQLGSVHPGAHVNTDRVLNPLWTETTTLLVERWDLAWELPEHDVIVNAIADADIARPALELAAHLTAATGTPIVNAPERVLATTRVENAARLQGIDGLRVPRVRRVSRGEAEALGNFPILLRAPGFHNGANFEKIESAAQLGAVLQRLPGEELLEIEYVDAYGADGAVRKYRAMAVGGKLLPAHLAIGEVWNLHYFSASMTPERQAEEARYLNGMREHLGERAYRALERIVEILDLDYCGIDFGCDRSGDVVLFEANASMSVYLPDDVPAHKLRRAAVFAIDGALTSTISRLARR
jgi:hypothetical protein